MEASQLIQMGCYKTEPKGRSTRNRAIYNPDKVGWREGGEGGKGRTRQEAAPDAKSKDVMVWQRDLELIDWRYPAGR